jgi:GTP cyclohydrolase IA
MILEYIGEDPDREGLLNTLEHYIKAMLFFIKGYKENLYTIVNSAMFYKDYNKIVIIKDIKFFLLYEHHLILFSKKV